MKVQMMVQMMVQMKVQVKAQATNCGISSVMPLQR